jgi:hypothetical protein
VLSLTAEPDVEIARLEVLGAEGNSRELDTLERASRLETELFRERRESSNRWMRRAKDRGLTVEHSILQLFTRASPR